MYIHDYYLLYCSDDTIDPQSWVLPLLRQQSVKLVPSQAAGGIPPASRVLIWLADEPLIQLLPELKQHDWQLAILPHPELERLRGIFAVADTLPAALTQLESAECCRPLDLLYCNDQPVFDSVSIGHLFSLRHSTHSPDESRVSRWKRFFHRIRSLGQLHLRPFRVVTEKDKMLNTAALGMLAVNRGDASPLTRHVLEEAQACDGMLNLLILSPRSLSDGLRFLFHSIFRRQQGMSRLPRYLGVIRSRRLEINSPHPFTYRVDDIPAQAKEVHLQVESAALRLLCPRKELDSLSCHAEKEVFRTQSLPAGDACHELTLKSLPVLYHADSEEFRDLFLLLKDNARLSQSYLILMVLSTLLALTGLFANSIPVIIGAMILAPLMAPIISLAMGLLRQHEQLTLDSLRTLLYGMGLALGCATLMTLITPLHTINSEIAARLSPTLLDLGVAIISGVAGAYAHSRSEVAKSLAGVAIAVALVPPLAVSGIGIGWLDWSVFSGAFLLFITNLIGIVLAAALTFMLLGFSPFRLARRGLAFALLLASAISIPLLLGFNKMVQEHRIISRLEHWQDAEVQLREIRVRHGQPLHLTLRLVSSEPLSTAQIDVIKQDIEQLLEQSVTLEATLSVKR